MNNPILSIYVATYNHEHYITQALDSILMQETKYTYEVLVGEDCSTDNTRAILKEYEKVHPGKLTVFYREHNMHRNEINNALDLMLRCRGKYIIALEGDDFWTDPNKIERQIDFLETHPDYIAVSHLCSVVDHDSRPKNERYPECREEQYSFRHYLIDILPGQLATVMYRNAFISPQYDASLLSQRLTPGDRAVYFWLLMNGKIHCMQERMSAYRHVTDRGSSFSATTKYCFTDYERLYDALIQFANKVNHTVASKVAQSLYLRNLVWGIMHSQCSISYFFQHLKKVEGKLGIILEYVVCRLKNKFFKLKNGIE